MLLPQCICQAILPLKKTGELGVGLCDIGLLHEVAYVEPNAANLLQGLPWSKRRGRSVRMHLGHPDQSVFRHRNQSQTQPGLVERNGDGDERCRRRKQRRQS